MFSISTVASSTRMPTASASPPSVMMLIVSPSAASTISDDRIDSGIETAMISVLRQLPRKTRIIRPVRQAAMIAFADHAVDRRPHEDRLIGQRRDLQFRRQLRLIAAACACTPLMMSSVEALPVLSTDSSDAALPIHAHDVRLRRVTRLARARHPGCKPSPRSPANGEIVQLVNRLRRRRSVSTLVFERADLVVPEGRIRFCAPIVLTTSAGESPFACSAGTSISTCTCRSLPP